MAKCPHCRRKLTGFFLDHELPEVRCGHCTEKVDPGAIFTRSTVNDLQFLIPEEQRDRFLGRIGFERCAKRRPETGAFVLFWTSLVGFALMVRYIEGDSVMQLLLMLMLGLATVLLLAWTYHKDAKKPRWRARKR